MILCESTSAKKLSITHTSMTVCVIVARNRATSQYNKAPILFAMLYFVLYSTPKFHHRCRLPLAFCAHRNLINVRRLSQNPKLHPPYYTSLCTLTTVSLQPTLYSAQVHRVMLPSSYTGSLCVLYCA